MDLQQWLELSVWKSAERCEVQVMAHPGGGTMRNQKVRLGLGSVHVGSVHRHSDRGSFHLCQSKFDEKRHDSRLDRWVQGEIEEGYSRYHMWKKLINLL
jgi:hypothetical protein